MMRTLTWSALLALLLATLAGPGAGATHCETKISVYGRSGAVQAGPPPYYPLSPGGCRLLEQYGPDQHILPPNVDHVTVRVNGDFGSGVTQLEAWLDGLGFVGSRVVLHRTENPLSGATYDLQGWALIPDAPTDGELKVTVRYAGGALATTTYKTTLTYVPPPLPAP